MIAAALARLAVGGRCDVVVNSRRGLLRTGPGAGELGVLFPGQGSQGGRHAARPGLHVPRDARRACPRLRPAGPGRSVWSDLIYPHPAFTADARAAQENELRATEVAQPALGAVNLGAWSVFRRFGVTADAFAGHSYGELVALCAPGHTIRGDLHHLSRERGRLMALVPRARRRDDARRPRRGCGRGGGRPGREALDLVIANRNSPAQCVLSGSTAADRPRRGRDAATTIAARRACRSRPRSTARSWRGPAGRSARSWRRSRSDRPRVPVFANTTAAKYPDNAARRPRPVGRATRPAG